MENICNNSERTLTKLRNAIIDLKHQDSERRRRGIFRLEELRWENIPALLIPLLSDPSPMVRHFAASSMSYHGRSDVKKALKARLRIEENAEVRISLIASLRSIACSTAFREFVRALHDESEDVVLQACAALGEIRDPRAIKPVKALLVMSSWHVRLCAVVALLMMGCQDVAILSVLEQLMREPEASTHDETASEIKSDYVRARVGGWVLEHGYLIQRPMTQIYMEARIMLGVSGIEEREQGNDSGIK